MGSSPLLRAFATPVLDSAYLSPNEVAESNAPTAHFSAPSCVWYCSTGKASSSVDVPGIARAAAFETPQGAQGAVPRYQPANTRKQVRALFHRGAQGHSDRNAVRAEADQSPALAQNFEEFPASCQIVAPLSLPGLVHPMNVSEGGSLGSKLKTEDCQHSARLYQHG